MTQNEYEKICSIIDKNQTFVCRDLFNSEWIINNRGIAEIKKEIKSLIKE